jgi:hypothetical protein
VGFNMGSRCDGAGGEGGLRKSGDLDRCLLVA